MAQGDTLAIFGAGDSEPTDNDTYKCATFDTRNEHLLLDYDDGTNQHECIFFSSLMPQRYSGRGVVVHIHYCMSSAVANDVFWGVAFEKMTGLNIASDSFATMKNAVDTVPGTAGQVTSMTITFADGAEMDSVAAGNVFRILLRRRTDQGEDTAAGDAELVSVEIKEN